MVKYACPDCGYVHDFEEKKPKEGDTLKCVICNEEFKCELSETQVPLNTFKLYMYDIGDGQISIRTHMTKDMSDSVMADLLFKMAEGFRQKADSKKEVIDEQ